MQPAYQAWAEDRDLPIAGAGHAPNHDVSRDPAYGYADPKSAGKVALSAVSWL